MERSIQNTSISDITPDVSRGRPLLAQLSWAVGRPPLTDNEITVLENGDAIFPSMLEDIRSAQRSIFFETFVYWTGRIAETFARELASAAQRGLDVRVLLDAYGSSPMNERLIETMRSSGVRVVRFRELRRWRIWQVDHRTHRRALIIDHHIAYTGGVGIAREWEGDARDASEWRDNHFRIRGPAVAGIFVGFVDNWSEACPRDPCPVPENFEAMHDVNGECDASVIASSPSSQWSPVATLYRDLWTRAEQSVRIATPYFVPDAASTELMRSALGRGVEVQVLIPGPHVDKRLSELAGHSAMKELIDAGARIHCYLPTMFHCKTVVVDDQVAVIGTANFNQRSQGKDDEMVVLAAGAGLVTALAKAYEEDWAQSKPWDECPISESWWARLASALFRPFREQF